jgi:hypothetical protein
VNPYAGDENPFYVGQRYRSNSPVAIHDPYRDYAAISSRTDHRRSRSPPYPDSYRKHIETSCSIPSFLMQPLYLINWHFKITIREMKILEMDGITATHINSITVLGNMLKKGLKKMFHCQHRKPH